MKILKFIPVVLVCLAVFASCNDDDDYKPLNGAEVGQCLSAMRGNYEGKVVFPVDTTKALTRTSPVSANTWINDTLNVSWTVGADTSLVVRNFPVNIIANYVKGNDDLAKALVTAAPQDITTKLTFYQTTPIIFNTTARTLVVKVNYGGKDHDVKIGFYANDGWTYNYYAAGQYAQGSNLCEFNLVLGAILVDSENTNYLYGTTGFYFYGSKK